VPNGIGSWISITARVSTVCDLRRTTRVFLFRPVPRVANLASRALSLPLRRLSADMKPIERSTLGPWAPRPPAVLSGIHQEPEFICETA